MIAVVLFLKRRCSSNNLTKTTIEYRNESFWPDMEENEENVPQLLSAINIPQIQSNERNHIEDDSIVLTETTAC